MSKNNPTDLVSKRKTDLANADLNTLARLVRKDVDVTPALSSNTADNMKAFLLIYSRSQLNRVVSLTNALGKLEDQLIQRAIANPEEYDPNTLMSIIRVLQNSLNQAINLIKQVTTDESYLSVIIQNTQVINNSLNQYNSGPVMPVLANQDSRDKVRHAVSMILAKVDELADQQGIDLSSVGGESNGVIKEAEIVDPSSASSSTNAS